MHRSQQAHRRSFVSRSRGAALACAVDALESRRLFSGETVTAIPSVEANLATPSANSITLDQYFTDANLPGTLATFKTNLGTITVALTDAATPLTVANFLSYVSSGAYTDTIFHRSAVLSSTGGGGSPTTPADIIQGGGYVVDGTTFKAIPTKAAVADEYTKEILNDSTGTLAMAKTSSANSATDEWYFNVHNNVSALDTPTTDSSGVTTSYTVFGRVLTGMNVVDEIAQLPTYNVSSTLSLTTVPVVGLTEGEATKNFPITANNLVYTESITAEPGTDYTVTSSNNALVTPKVTNGVLSFTYASGLSGTANITVLAKNLDGTSASTAFAVTVPNSATPTAGPVAAAITAPNIVTGTTGTFSVLGNATDSVAALNPGSVTITTQPAHGTATVNTSTGSISYTPTAGYTGSDSLAYTVADTAGTVSNAATVTLNVVPTPVSVTIGTANARSLTFTQPGGAVGHLFVSGGTAVVTFAGNPVSTTTTGGVVSATGAGATIASIVITNRGAAASLRLTATGAVSLGSITDAGAVSIISAPNATVTGTVSFKSINRLILAGAAKSTLSLGSGNATTVVIPSVTDTSLTDTGSIAGIISTQWLNDDGGYYAVTTPRIGRLKVTGGFADILNLTGAGTSLAVSSVGQASAAWTISGAVGTATFATPASTWSLVSGRVGNLIIGGNLANGVTAAGLGSLTVTGTTTGATLDITGGQINRLKFGGAVSTTAITSAGSIASILAASLSSTQITAATIGTLIVPGAANTATIRTTAAATDKVQIGQLRLGATTSSTISTAGSIGSLSTASLNSTQVASAMIGSIVVSGATTSATIQTSAGYARNKLEIGRVILGGAVSSTLITSVGNIGNIVAGSLTGSHIYAGLSSTITQSLSLPTSTSDFTNAARIASVVLGKGAGAFSNTLISAQTIGQLLLGNITSANNSTPEGVAAHKLGRVIGTLAPGGVINAGPAQLKSATTLAAYEKAQKLSLGDFVITLD